MVSIIDALNPILWVAAALAAAFALFISPRSKRDVRLTASALFVLAALGLLAATAVAAWLPPQALLTHPDGSTDDPRAITAVVLAIATLFGLAPALRSLRMPQLGLLGVLLPGVALGGLVAAITYFVGLRAPVALGGITLAGITTGTSLVLFARLRGSGFGALSLQMGATGVLLAAGVLSLNGARAQGIQLGEGAVVDTLGHRIMLGAVQAPHDSLRRMEFVLVRGPGSKRIWTSLEGRPGGESHSVAGGGIFAGPLVIPMGLQETRPSAHELVWLTKGDSTLAGTGTVRFVGFRIVAGDTVRMLADLDVRIGGVTRRVSPGMYASAKATTPFPAIAEGIGPIAVAKIDADNHRVGLMLPAPSTAAVTRTAVFEMHLRPALTVAWAAGALVVIAFLLGLAARVEGPRSGD